MVDSRATAQMVCIPRLLQEFEPVYETTITVGDGRKLQAKGRGKIVVSSTAADETGVNLVLSNVLLVPGMDSNFLDCAERGKDTRCSSMIFDLSFLTCMIMCKVREACERVIMPLA